MNAMFAFFNLGPMEIVILLVVGVMMFGRRLPEVGRYLGKGIVEFKKGIKGIEDEVEPAITRVESQPSETPRAPQKVAATAPRFDDSPISKS
jgi:sec-independent protein translocase protein TatA